MEEFAIQMVGITVLEALVLPLSDLLALKKIVDAGNVLQSKEPLMTMVLEEQMLVVSPAERPEKDKITDTKFWYAIAKKPPKYIETHHQPIGGRPQAQGP